MKFRCIVILELLIGTCIGQPAHYEPYHAPGPYHYHPEYAAPVPDYPDSIYYPHHNTLEESPYSISPPYYGTYPIHESTPSPYDYYYNYHQDPLPSTEQSLPTTSESSQVENNTATSQRAGNKYFIILTKQNQRKNRNKNRRRNQNVEAVIKYLVEYNQTLQSISSTTTTAIPSTVMPLTTTASTFVYYNPYFRQQPHHYSQDEYFQPPGPAEHPTEFRPGHHSYQSQPLPADNEPRDYSFGYQVHSPQTNDFKRVQERREGNLVTGQYSFLQPDGVTRTVTYLSHPKHGFNAVVHNDNGLHTHGPSGPAPHPHHHRQPPLNYYSEQPPPQLPRPYQHFNSNSTDLLPSK